MLNFKGKKNYVKYILHKLAYKHKFSFLLTAVCFLKIISLQSYNLRKNYVLNRVVRLDCFDVYLILTCEWTWFGRLPSFHLYAQYKSNDLIGVRYKFVILIWFFFSFSVNIHVDCHIQMLFREQNREAMSRIFLEKTIFQSFWTI
jgi:hypothetical protein